METRKYLVTNGENFNVSLATQIVDSMSHFDSRIIVKYFDDQIDAKSIINLMTLDLEDDTELEVEAQGNDAQKSLDTFEELLKNNKVI